MISFACPTCSQAYSVADDKAGLRSKCKRCGDVLVIPNQLEPVYLPSPPPPPAPSTPFIAAPSERAPVTSVSGPADRETDPTRYYVAATIAVLVVIVLAMNMFSPKEAPAPTFTAVPPPAPVDSVPSTKVTRENFLAIRDGMGEDEVKLILGRPSKRRSSENDPDCPYTQVTLTWEEFDKYGSWVKVYFNRPANGGPLKVINKKQSGFQ